MNYNNRMCIFCSRFVRICYNLNCNKCDGDLNAYCNKCNMWMCNNCSIYDKYNNKYYCYNHINNDILFCYFCRIRIHKEIKNCNICNNKICDKCLNNNGINCINNYCTNYICIICINNYKIKNNWKCNRCLFYND